MCILNIKFKWFFFIFKSFFIIKINFIELNYLNLFDSVIDVEGMDWDKPKEWEKLTMDKTNCILRLLEITGIFSSINEIHSLTPYGVNLVHLYNKITELKSKNNESFSIRWKCNSNDLVVGESLSIMKAAEHGVNTIFEVNSIESNLVNAALEFLRNNMDTISYDREFANNEFRNNFQRSVAKYKAKNETSWSKFLKQWLTPNFIKEYLYLKVTLQNNETLIYHFNNVAGIVKEIGEVAELLSDWSIENKAENYVIDQKILIRVNDNKFEIVDASLLLDSLHNYREIETVIQQKEILQLFLYKLNVSKIIFKKNNILNMRSVEQFFRYD